MKIKWYAAPYIAWMVLFTLAPLALLLFYAFTARDGGLTVSNFAQFFDPMYLKILGRSLWLALLCTIICLALGYPVAFILSRRGEHSLLSVLFILPMWMNFLLRTYAWMSLLENTGLINKILIAIGVGQMTLLYNSNAVLLGMVYNFLPFMILPILTVMRKMNRSLLEASSDLGSNPRGTFRRVILPMSVPGIVSGVTMVFIPAVTTFVISRLLGGSQFMLFGDLLEQEFLQMNDWNFGSALSIVMMVIMLACISLMNRVSTSDLEGGGALL